MGALATALLAAAEQGGADTTWFDHLRGAAEIAGGVVAAGLILGGGRGLWRRSLGRKRDTSRRLRRLGTNAHLSFFEAVLGGPPAIRRSVEGKRTDYVEDGQDFRKVEHPRTFREYIWIESDYYLQAVTDQEDTVQAFSVTTRDAHFNPRFRALSNYFVQDWWILRKLKLGRQLRTFDLRLAKTHFSALEQPERIDAYMGAHTFGYSERHYYGNPEGYQHFVCTVNDAGVQAWDATQVLFDSDGPWDITWGTDWENDPAFEEFERVIAFRKAATINTFTVIGPDLDADDYPVTYGPHEHHVRTIP